MANILGVGVATLDIINTVDAFPEEDTEVRASAQSLRRGGNATNTLVILSQLGNSCAWAGTLADDANSEIIRADLAKYAVDMSAVQQLPGGCVPTSYVTLNQFNGSRSIVHYRDLPEYRFERFREIDLAAYDWLHFEGRNVEQTQNMLEYAREQAPTVPRSVEIEKSREGVEVLCDYANLLLYSRCYVVEQGMQQNPKDLAVDPLVFLETAHNKFPFADHVCTWGNEGAWGVSCSGQIIHSPAMQLSRVVDTLGAGDTFNAGMIQGQLKGLNLEAVMEKACQLAGKKCRQEGFQQLVD